MAGAGEDRLDIAGLGPDDARRDAHGVEAFGDDDPVLDAPPLRALLRDLEQTEFKRSASREADRFVYRPPRVKPPAAAPWRGLCAR
jgi:hypothetical protein